MRNIIYSYLALTVILFSSCKQDKVSDATTDREAKNKKERLISVVESYINGIKEKDFSKIPYSDSVTLRSPLTKYGMRLQLKGRYVLYKDWWEPLILRPGSKEVVFRVVAYHLNETLTSIIAESVVTDNNVEPPATVYVAERFTINKDGKIIDQVNYFDVRDVLNPGWQDK